MTKNKRSKKPKKLSAKEKNLKLDVLSVVEFDLSRDQELLLQEIAEMPIEVYARMCAGTSVVPSYPPSTCC